jgi:hypothetical protein
MTRLFPAALRFLLLAATVALGLTAAAQELALREMLPGRGFSIQVPEGFDATKNTEKGSLSCTRPSDRATFEAREVEFDGELSVLAKAASDAMEKQLADYKLIEQKPFTLKSGLKGLKLYLEMRPSKGGPIVRQMLYFFDGRPGHKGFVTCGALAKDDPKLHPLWDKVVGSVVISE